MKVLLVHREAPVVHQVRSGLRDLGHDVVVAGDGRHGLAEAVHGDYDVVLMEILLPGLSGYEVLRRMRARQVWTPTIVITSKDGEYDQADAFDLGADDYLVKPVSIVVLEARMRALRRRVAQSRPEELRLGDLVLEPSRHRVFRSGQEITLTSREFAVLEYLMHRPEEVVSKADLLADVWNDYCLGNANMVELYVGYLRKKIDRKFGRVSIQTVRGRGYRIVDDSKPAMTADQLPVTLTTVT
jgi:two-component system OmpR family response regulator